MLDLLYLIKKWVVQHGLDPEEGKRHFVLTCRGYEVSHSYYPPYQYGHLLAYFVSQCAFH